MPSSVFTNVCVCGCGYRPYLHVYPSLYPPVHCYTQTTVLVQGITCKIMGSHSGIAEE